MDLLFCSWHSIPNSIFVEFPGEMIGLSGILTSKPLNFLNFNGRECAEYTDRYLRTVGFYLGKLFSNPIKYGGLNVECKGDGLLADSAQMWKYCSNIQGGNLRCFDCDTNFSKEHIRNSMSYQIYKKSKEKSTFSEF